MNNCPFYGRSFAQFPREPRDPAFLLISSHGNQCAVICDAHSPCREEIEGRAIDWKTCVLVQSRVNIG